MFKVFFVSCAQIILIHLVWDYWIYSIIIWNTKETSFEEVLFHKNRLIFEILFWDWRREDQKPGNNFEKRPYEQMLSIKNSPRKHELRQYQLSWKK